MSMATSPQQPPIFATRLEKPHCQILIESPRKHGDQPAHPGEQQNEINRNAIVLPKNLVEERDR